MKQPQVHGAQSSPSSVRCHQRRTSISVSLAFVEHRVNVWLRFGTPVRENHPGPLAARCGVRAGRGLWPREVDRQTTTVRRSGSSWCCRRRCGSTVLQHEMQRIVGRDCPACAFCCTPVASRRSRRCLK